MDLKELIVTAIKPLVITVKSSVIEVSLLDLVIIKPKQIMAAFTLATFTMNHKLVASLESVVIHSKSTVVKKMMRPLIMPYY